VKRFIIGLLLLGLPTLIIAQVQSTAAVAIVEASPAQGPALFSLLLSPELDIPLGESIAVFGLGGGARIWAEYRLPFLPLLYLSGGLSYDYETATSGVALTASVASASLGSGLRFDFAPWLSATVGLSGGYFYSFLNTDLSISGGNPFVSADAGVILLPGPLHISVGASYSYYFGLSNGLSFALGLAYDIARPNATVPAKLPPRPAKPLSVPPEGRFALVIGNSAYAHVSRLNNPSNDAQDMANELKRLGFAVDLLLNADYPAMEKAVVRFGNKLSSAREAVGFFYYAGHGVQSGGANYLIPVDADIPSASFLQQKSLAFQSVLDTVQDAGNELNVIVLDACRDNPFSWSRSGTRGFTVVTAQPTGSIIVYATSAGSVAQDGEGRNGIFTGQLLKHLDTPGADINDVFRQTGASVRDETNGSQIPAIYSQFFDSFVLSAPANP
jgi:hypothetical protein